MEWEVAYEPLDIIWVEEANKIYACCQDGVYELPRETIDSDDDDDLFLFDESESVKKKRCVVAEKVKKKAVILKIKFKRSAKCFDYHNGVLYSLHIKGDQAYVETTSLHTFQCSNPSLCVVQGENQIFGDSWILVESDELFVFVFGHCYKGILDNTASRISLRKLAQIQQKIQLYSEGLIERPHYDGNDLIEKIIDKKELVSKKDSPKMVKENCQDMKFISHEHVLLLSNGTLTEYKKNGRTYNKKQMPFLVSMCRPLGQGKYYKGYCHVVTKYFSIYKRRVSTAVQQTNDDDDNGLATNNQALTDILDSSKDLEVLIAKRKYCEDMLQQLGLCTLSSDERINFDADFRINEEDMLILTVTNNGPFDLIGRYWSLHLNFGNRWQKRLPLPMQLFRKGSKWSLPATSLSHFTVEDLPLKVTSALMFHHDVNDLVIATYPWLQYSLTVTDLIRWKATLNCDTSALVEESFDFNGSDTHFESFLRGLNAQKISSKEEKSNETNDKAATLCLNVKGKHERKTQRLIDNLIEGIECSADRKTTYIDVLKVPMILSFQLEKDFIFLTIRSRHVDDFDYALQLKEDILKHAEGKTKKSNVIRTVKAAIASIDFESSDKDLALQHCYRYWREANCS